MPHMYSYHMPQLGNNQSLYVQHADALTQRQGLRAR